MTQDIKFTPFGIPYILEFENVSFVPEPSTVPEFRYSGSSDSDSFCYIESPPPPPRFPSFSLRSASSLFKRKATHGSTPNSEPPPPPPKSDVSESLGIYIQFPPGHSHPQMRRKQRLVHLQQTISIAVLDAGMSRSPGNTTHPENHPSDNPSHQTRGYRSADALFCGTYGQMMAALEGARLSATPCVGDGQSGHTRLGVLFVARNNGASGIQLRKITLWG